MLTTFIWPSNSPPRQATRALNITTTLEACRQRDSFSLQTRRDWLGRPRNCLLLLSSGEVPLLEFPPLPRDWQWSPLPVPAHPFFLFSDNYSLDAHFCAWAKIDRTAMRIYLLFSVLWRTMSSWACRSPFSMLDAVLKACGGEKKYVRACLCMRVCARARACVRAC